MNKYVYDVISCVSAAKKVVEIIAYIVKIGDLLLNTEKKDAVNHSAIKDLNQKTIISIGPGKNWIQPKGCVDHYLNRFLGGSGATNEYPIHGTDMPIKLLIHQL